MVGIILLNIYFFVFGLRDNSNGRLINLFFGVYYNFFFVMVINVCVVIVGGRGDFFIFFNLGRYWFRIVWCVVDDFLEFVILIYMFLYDVNK